MHMGFGLVHMVNLVGLVVWLKDMLFIEKHAFYNAKKHAKSIPFYKHFYNNQLGLLGLHTNSAAQSTQSNDLVLSRYLVQLTFHQKMDAWDESLSNPIPTLFQVQNHFVSMLPKHLL